MLFLKALFYTNCSYYKLMKNDTEKNTEANAEKGL